MDKLGARSSGATHNPGRVSALTNTENKPEELTEGTAGGGGEGGKLMVGITSKTGKSQPNFFDLLAAAVSAAKTDTGKGNFQEYLRVSGVKMAWVRAVVALYEEPKKPDDPLAYILKLMGLGIPEVNEVKSIQERLKNLRVRLLQLQNENDYLRESIEEEEAALEQRQELVSLFDDSKYFPQYNSDDDQEVETQTLFSLSEPELKKQVLVPGVAQSTISKMKTQRGSEGH